VARGDRYVALGLARARSGWFGEVGRWSTSAALPLEFLKCVTVEEVRARFRTGRPFSALLVDGSVPSLDRDLVDEARSCGCAVIVVDDGRVQRDWRALGAAAVLTSNFGRDDLLDVLEAHAVRIGVGTTHDDSAHRLESDRDLGGWRGHLVAVTRSGGAGASTLAMALAQGLAADVRDSGLVALADLALDADQAMLHDAGDVVPGIQELVDLHRSSTPGPSELRSLTYSVADRNYDLVLGLRRHRDWVTIRPRAFEATLDGLRRAYKTVVADVSDDVEGERQCGSMDVEERNLMARDDCGCGRCRGDRCGGAARYPPCRASRDRATRTRRGREPDPSCCQQGPARSTHPRRDHRRREHAHAAVHGGPSAVADADLHR
jgi:hypothetical protein